MPVSVDLKGFNDEKLNTMTTRIRSPVKRKRKIAQIDENLIPVRVPTLAEFLLLYECHPLCFRLAKRPLALLKQLSIFLQMRKLEKYIESQESAGPHGQLAGFELDGLRQGR